MWSFAFNAVHPSNAVQKGIAGSILDNETDYVICKSHVFLGQLKLTT
jgi:hypothetical protein